MKKVDTKNRISLILVFSLVIFIILFISVGITALIIYAMAELAGVFTFQENSTVVSTILLLMFFISLLIGFGVSVLTSILPLKPINRIITQTNRLASGDFTARLEFGKPLGTHPAIVEVCDSFNKMAEELEGTELLRHDFINNFSHEFKTPIVSIAGFAKLLKRGTLTEAQRAEYIDIIEEESMRLAHMATNVFDLTKVENQTILTGVTEFNLSEQIRSSVLLLEDKWAKKKLELELDFAEYSLQASEELLKQVWINLLDNAVKFSRPGGTVGVHISERKRSLAVAVSNEGSSIPPEQQKKIFGKFYQADESHASEGNGVGLAIVKRIVDLHGGSVEVQSSSGMTVFTVELPKRQRSRS